VDAVASKVRAGKHLVAESGTGTGKTICSLCGALPEAMASGRKVLYLTRTNSQQKQVMMELRRISESVPVFGLGIQGRQSTCPLIQRDPELRSGNPEELSRLCSDRKNKAMQGREGGCRFYQATMEADMSEIEAHCRETLPTVEEFSDYCDRRGLCPHELVKDMLPKVNVATAPYAYFFVPFIRPRLLDWMNSSISNVVLIVDEAHNLPDYAREISSVKVTERMLDLVGREVNEFGDPEVMSGVSVNDVLEAFRWSLRSALDEFLIEDDGLIPPSFLEESLMSRFKATSAALNQAAIAMMAHGEAVKEERRSQGRLPRSYIGSLGASLRFWLDTDEECYVKLVTGGDNPSFEAYCMDPSVACGAVRDCRASLHMSGTLAPLNEYRDSIGLPRDSGMVTYPSPFPPENRLVLYYEDVTTKYEDMASDEGIVPLMEERAVAVCNTLDRNVVVFFPSYQLMDRFLADGLAKRIRRKVHMERRGMAQADLMEAVETFKRSEDGAVLLAVMGGRVSEGIDFPDKELEAAVIIGLPYPKPTAKQRAMLHYYEIKFGRGWDYTVKAPATRKLLQAVGRLIRTGTDVGAAVILDRRAAQFSDRLAMRPTEAAVNDMLNFFSERGK